MISFQKLTVLLLTLILLLGCTACGSQGSEKERSDKEKLHAILDDISASVKPEADSGVLTTVRITADLVAWAASTKMSSKETAAAVSEWIQNQPEEEKAAFREKMKHVAQAYGKQALEEAKELAEEAGEKIKDGSLTDQAKTILEAILASGGVN